MYADLLYKINIEKIYISCYKIISIPCFYIKDIDVYIISQYLFSLILISQFEIFNL